MTKVLDAFCRDLFFPSAVTVVVPAGWVSMVNLRVNEPSTLVVVEIICGTVVPK